MLTVIIVAVFAHALLTNEGSSITAKLHGLLLFLASAVASVFV